MHKKQWILGLSLCSLVLSANALANNHSTQKNPPANNLANASRSLDDYRLWIDEKGWFASAEFLYWVVHEQKLDYAVAKNFPTFQDLTTGSVDGLAGKVHRAHFTTEPGGRVELGYQFPYDNWELSGMYTYFHSVGSNSATPPKSAGFQGFSPISVLTATLSSVLNVSGGTTLIPIQEARSHIKITYQVADLILTKHFLPSKNILLGIFAGAKGAWIDQHWRLKYSGTVPSSTTVETTHLKENWSFEGGGLQFGFDLDWCLPRGVSWYTNGAFAALVGSHKVHSEIVASAGRFNPLYQSIHPHTCRVVTATQLQTGFAWTYPFKESSLRFWFGYEANIWNNLHEVYRFVGTLFDQTTNDKRRVIDSSTVAFHGLTAGFFYHF